MATRALPTAETENGLSLEISVTSGGSGPVGFGPPDRCKYLPGVFFFAWYIDLYGADGKRGRPKAGIVTGLSGNISYVRRFMGSRFRVFPDRCKNLPARFCFARYIEL